MKRHFFIIPYLCPTLKLVMMKKLVLSLSVILICLVMDAQQLNTPAPSPTVYLKQNFALSSIELSYSRPGVKGRKVFGDLVPYGKVWRTGANSATTITFGEDVMINGTKVPAGKYGLLTIPEEKEWTVIISKQTNVTSPADYKQEEDLVRVKTTVQTLPFAVETFMINVGDIKDNSCAVGFIWDNVYTEFKVAVDIDSKIMGQIKDAMEKDNRPYFNAAMYYMNNGKDLNQALAWFDKAVEMNPTAFWIHHQRANCLARLGKKSEAKTAAEKSKQLAMDAKNDDYVKLNEKLLAELKK